MAIQVSFPGVYIDEFTPAAPIQGVGTSTAAFIGLCKYGPPNKPTLITSWDAFLKTFTSGDPATDPPDDDDYLWYAVRGFFQNGGQVCYVTAVSNAKADAAVLDDEATTPKHTITITARELGVLSPPITVTAVTAHAVPADPLQPAKLFEPSATIATTSTDLNSVDVTDPTVAAKFLAGDRVQIDTIATGEEATVARFSGSFIFFTAPLSKTYTNKALSFVALPAFCISFRVEKAEGLVAGSIITLSQNGATSQTTVVTSVSTERISLTLTTFRVTVADGINGFTLYKAGNKPITLQSQEFKLTVSGQAQTYNLLSMNSGHPRYYATVINNDPDGLVLAEPYVGTLGPNTTALPANRPSGTYNLGGGANYNVAAIRANPLPFYPDVLKVLEGIGDINIVAVPDRSDAGVQVAVLDHCSRLRNRFAIFDAAKGTELGDITTKRNELENNKGFGALYYPWIEVISAKTGQRILVPPSGHVAGIYARIDNSRGVFKAPAGTEAIINGTVGVEKLFSNIDQGTINLKGINVIRVFQSGGRPVVWGARTTSADTNWQYVNIRRLFIFLEESIQQGIRGAVFEPNNLALWEKLKRTIRAFLMTQWRDGALFGKTAEEAFYIRIDEVINPFSEQALGRLNIEIGVRPSYPAEFIVVRIGIWQGGSNVSES